MSIAAIAGWVGSLFLPALSFQFDGHHDRLLFGYQVLASGWFDLIVLEFSWLSNFTFWFLVWLLWRRSQRRRWLVWGSLVTVLLSAQSIEIFIWDQFFESPKPRAGYFAWLASNLLLSVAAFMIAAAGGRRLAESRVSR